MKILKFWLKQLLVRMNLDVRRIGVAPQILETFANADPITFQYLADLKIAPVRQISVADARAGIMGFGFGDRSGHPLLQAFLAAKNKDDHASRAAIRNVLKDFYGSVRPNSALDVVSVAATDAPGLMEVSLHSWVMPWTERSPQETEAHRRICLEEEGLSGGKKLSLSDGATLFGPVSETKLELEVERIRSLQVSIANRGFYSDPAHPIEVVGLEWDGEYRWLIVQGQHRVAACAAYGILAVEARVLRIIRRADADHWPHVVLGRFTSAGAKKCFDRVFAGQESSCAASWAVRFKGKDVDRRNKQFA